MISLEYEKARACIEAVKDNEMQMFLKAIYLLAAEGCELTGRLDSGAGSYRRIRKVIYCPRGTDVTQLNIPIQNQNLIFPNIGNLSETPIALFKLKVARQDLKDYEDIPTRIVALPFSKKYEPWTQQLCDHWRSKGNDFVFDFNRHKAWRYLYDNKVFKNLTYQIRSYEYFRHKAWMVSERQGTANSSFKVHSHQRKVKMLGLRRLRSYELMEKYKFDWTDLKVYLSTKHLNKKMAQDIDSSINWEDWNRYIRKLCIEN